MKEWDKKLQRQKRQILLLVDNCTAHVEVKGLKNIKLEYFPPNVTSLLQPMDQGIIKNLKAYYRRYLVQKLLQTLDKDGEMKKLDLLQAVHLVDNAWQSVTAKTVKSCFTHAGLRSEVEDVVEMNLEDETEQLVQEIAAALHIDHDLANAYIDVDKEVNL